MKTTSWIWIGCLAVGVANAGQPACAGPQPGLAAALLAAAATGQTEDETSEETRRRCLEMLSRARRAMEEGDTESAQSWLEKAEALKVPFKRTAPGDTPAKVRKDLEQASASAKPERREAASEGRRAECDALLVEARKALATGDVRRAQSLADKAERMALEYKSDADSPAKVSAAIQNWSDLAGADAKKRSDYARKQARCLVEQAEALAAWGEFDEAERLCEDVERLEVRFNPFETSPKTVRERIATARRNQGGRGERLPAADKRSEAKDRAVALVREAREALDAGDLKKAEALANEADALGVPDDAFGPTEDRHWRVLHDVQRRRDRSTVQAGGSDDDRSRFAGTRALYEPERDATRNEQASDEGADEESEEEVAGVTEGMDLYLQGEEALRAGDREEAVRLFTEAYRRGNELDAATRQRLQDRLSRLGTNVRDIRPAGGQEASELTEADADAQIAGRRVAAELTRQESAARRVQETDPKAALQILQSARADVDRSELDDAQKQILLRRVDRRIGELEAFIAANKPQIDLEEQNRRTLDEIDRERQMKLDVQQRLAALVEQYNQLIDQERFEEAEVLAKQAYELAPDEPVAVQLRNQSKVMHRLKLNSEIQASKEEGYVAANASIEKSSEPFDDQIPYRMPPVREWEELRDRRRRFRDADDSRLTPRELEIQKLLKTPVSAQYDNAPLSMVIHDLCKLAGISVHIDEAGLAHEGVTVETPVDIDIANEIMLKSALSLILDEHNLAYIVRNEVLKITSKAMAGGEVYRVVYDVGDLVMPIPNFVANGNMGLNGALNDAHSRTSMGGNPGFPGSPLAAIGGAQSRLANITNPNVMAQVDSPNLPPAVGAGEGLGAIGPGGAGGGVQPDFDALIELITTTIEPDSWDENGGAGAIQEFAGNLTLVVSNTEAVHEEVAKLLTQLRRLQDLQVTIEVRFITLNDNYFERIGVDFDFDINDNIDRAFNIFGNPIGNARPTTTTPPNGAGPRNTLDRDLRPNESVTVGLQAPNVFSADLDIPFRQESFGLAVPQFGGFQPGAGATMGFSILSDLEAFFFMEASQGDRRSNVLQAPKVTLFNGQSASVSDISQSPFVISLIPVVGDFAAAYMPVIVVLNEGSHLTVNAVVSNDRRFVRLTVVPFFSKITDVNTFRFTGSDSTIEESEDEGADDKSKKKKSSKRQSSEGTTVQLPTFSFVSVSTTVSVPDGGTVLLGGIKRLSEGRNEFGVPILNKIPYLNRLFRNVGIGRETQSLMMMVTPRIIIQEEEEENLMQGAPLAP